MHSISPSALLKRESRRGMNLALIAHMFRSARPLGSDFKGTGQWQLRCGWPRRTAGAVVLLGAVLACEPSPPAHKPKAGALLTDSEPQPHGSGSQPSSPPPTANADRGGLPTPAATAPASGECLLVPGDAVRRISLGRYQLTRIGLLAARQELASHAKRWFHEGALTWTTLAGKPALKVTGLTRADCGIQNGDLVLSIQGVEMAMLKRNPKRLHDELEGASQIDITLLRDDARRRISYEIVERLL